MIRIDSQMESFGLDVTGLSRCEPLLSSRILVSVMIAIDLQVFANCYRTWRIRISVIGVLNDAIARRRIKLSELFKLGRDHSQRLG